MPEWKWGVATGIAALMLGSAWLPAKAGLFDDAPERPAAEDPLKTLETELEALRRELIASAADIRASEQAIIALEKEVDALRAREQDLMDGLTLNRADLSRLLGGMIQLTALPPGLVLAMPGDPDENLRAGIVTGALADDLRMKSARLDAKLQQLQMLREDREVMIQQTLEKKRELETRRLALEDKVTRRSRLISALHLDNPALAAEVKKLAGQAGDLDSLLQRLQETHGRLTLVPVPVTKPLPTISGNALASLNPAAGGRRSFASAKGQLGFPAEGRIIHAFGKPGAAPETRSGITIETREHAPVVAPFDGEVMFTGPFMGYGKLLIIRHNGGYHTLLAGLERIDVTPGQKVIEGEPIGRMGRLSNDLTRLYMEVRKKSKPVNPMAWFDNEGKARG